MRGKRLIAAGVAAATLAGGAYAFAANLTVTSQNLGAGTDDITNSCTIDSSYLTSYSNTDHKYYVTEIDLNTTTPVSACASKYFKVAVDLGSGNSKQYVGQFDGTGKYVLNASSTTTVVTPAPPATALPGSIGATDLDANKVVQITAVVTDVATS